MLRGMLSFFIWVLVAYALFCGVLFCCQRLLLYHPNQIIPDPSEFGLRDVSAIRIDTEDNYKLLAWWHSPKKSFDPVFVYFHGNAGHLGHRAEKVRHFTDAGYGVLLVSYRYNAGAGGSPSENGLYTDARAAIKFIKGTQFSDNPLIVYGESLGTAIAVNVASENNVAAVILEAPYTSIADVAQSHYWYLPSRYLVLDKFNAARQISRIGAPLLILHGDRDAVIPSTFGRSLFEKAVEPKQMIYLPQAGHNDLYDHGAVGYILKFIKNKVLKSIQ